MAQRVILSVGTKRGLFLLEAGKGRKRWKVTGPLLKGWSVPHAVIDTRGAPRMHVAASSYTYGSTTLSSGVRRHKFEPAKQPPAFPKLNPSAAKFVKKYGIDASEKLWIIAPGPEREKKVLYAGTAPAGLFRSEDRGASWEPVEGINRHPTKKDWAPGAGGQCLHSIQIDPHDPQKMYVAISAAGAFRTDDGGQKWKPINSCVADYVGAPKESQVGT